MTAGALIAAVDELRPNQYAAARKLEWLRRLDGQILAEIESSHAPAGAGSSGGEAEDEAVLSAAYTADTELLAAFPWDEALYTAWLFCQIDLHNGEIGKYNQSLALFQAAWSSLADAVNRARRPLGASRLRL